MKDSQEGGGSNYAGGADKSRAEGSESSNANEAGGTTGGQDNAAESGSAESDAPKSTEGSGETASERRESGETE